MAVLMKIDAHQHFWIYNPVRDTWIDDSMKILQKNFLPKDLEPVLKQSSIDGTIAVQADQSENETSFLLNLAEKNKWILGVVGWIDLMAPDIEKKLEHFSNNKKLKGLRHIVQAEPDDNFMLNEKFRGGISLLKNYNYTYDILIYPRQLPAAIKLTEKHYEQKFVLDHIAKPFIRKKEIEPWASGIKSLAENANVYCKISGIITEADHQNWKPQDIYPYLDIVFEAFSVDRLLFGSDWPVCLLAGSYEKVFNLVNEYTNNFPEENKEKIFGKNAISFYNINIS
jgi:L-fuconolactonase